MARQLRFSTTLHAVEQNAFGRNSLHVDNLWLRRWGSDFRLVHLIVLSLPDEQEDCSDDGQGEDRDRAYDDARKGTCGQTLGVLRFRLRGLICSRLSIEGGSVMVD